jgi:hypothetical protein
MRTGHDGRVDCPYRLSGSPISITSEPPNSVWIRPVLVEDLLPDSGTLLTVTAFVTAKAPELIETFQVSCAGSGRGTPRRRPEARDAVRALDEGVADMPCGEFFHPSTTC